MEFTDDLDGVDVELHRLVETEELEIELLRFLKSRLQKTYSRETLFEEFSKTYACGKDQFGHALNVLIVEELVGGAVTEIWNTKTVYGINVDGLRLLRQFQLKHSSY
jgi:hypothetical protein